jgi:hypothetical protein
MLFLLLQLSGVSKKALSKAPLQLPSRGERFKTPPYSPHEGRDISRRYLSVYDSFPLEGRLGRVFIIYRLSFII